MCRLLAYYGDPVLLAHTVVWPDRSIIRQSYDARERKRDDSLPAHLCHGNLNADGFGIGWYGEHTVGSEANTPCTFKAITPAWSNENLINLSSKITSSLIFAHVRAAYPGMPVSEQNCHPFTFGPYLFMHNGICAGFAQIRRRLLARLSDEAYDAVNSFHSDSAVMFALFLSFLPDMREVTGPEAMLTALQAALECICDTQAEAGVRDQTSLLNYVVSDGHTLIATRFVAPEMQQAASLYYAEGSTFRRTDGLNQCGEAPYTLEFADNSPRVVIVASEPITGAASEWVAVQKNHGLIVTRDPDGCMHVLHMPMRPQRDARFEEVLKCLRAIPLQAMEQETLTGATSVTSMSGGDGRPPRLSHSMRSFSASNMASMVTSSSGLRGSVVGPQVDGVVARSVTPPPWASGGHTALRSSSEVPPTGARGCDDRQAGQSPRCARVSDSSARLGGRLPKGVAGSGLLFPDSLAEPHLMRGHEGAILSMVQGKEGLLYTSSVDKTIKVWDPEEQRCLATWRGHSKPVLKLQVQGPQLFSIGGSSIRIWDLSTGACVQRILTSRNAGTLRALCITPTRSVVVGCQDTTLRLYRAAPPASSTTPTASCFDLPVSCTTDATASTPPSRKSSCRDAAGGADAGVERVGGGAGGAAGAPAFLRDEHEPPVTAVASLALNRAPAADAAAAAQPPEGPAAARGAAGQGPTPPLGRAVFDVSAESTGVVEPVMTGRLDEGHCAAVQSVVLAESFVCSAGADSVVRVWRRDNLELVSNLWGHRGPVFTLVVVGDLLLSGGRDRSIRVWDLVAMCCRRTLKGHHGDILHLTASAAGVSWNGDNVAEEPPGATQLAGSLVDDAGGAGGGPDGSGAAPVNGQSWALLASSSTDGCCRLWDLRTWVCVHVLVPSPEPMVQPVLCAAIIGQQIALGLRSGDVYVYDAEPLISAVAQMTACIIERRGSCASAVVADHIATPRSICPLAQCTPGGSAICVPEDSHGAGSPAEATLPCSNALAAQDTPAAAAGAAGSGAGRLITWRRPHQDKHNAQLRAEAQLLHCLSQFVSIQTVSGDPTHLDDCFEGAKYLASIMESVGMQVKLVGKDNMHPCVFGRLEICAERPTVVFYGHYDVQPAREKEWKTDPFHMRSMDGYLYGRGVSDNKGPILAMVFAVKELLERREGEPCAGLPVNLAFVFEGEEEIGSQGLSAAIDQNRHWCKNTELIVISNSQWIADELPCITYGMRGMICLTVRVDGAERDLHSGNDGGVFNEPMMDLCRLLGTLLDSQHNILVPGFYDDVDDDLLQHTLLGMQTTSEQPDFDVAAYTAALQVPALTCGCTKEEVLTARWCRPSLSIADIRSSTTDQLNTQFGPTRFSVIPKFAQANISVRFVPNQTSQELVKCLERHLQHEFRKLRSRNRLSINVRSVGPCWNADPSGPRFQDALEAIKAEWGRQPLAVREGGTMPCASMLETKLGAPAIMVPMGQNSDNCHLANERIRKQNLMKGKNVVRRIIEGFRQ